MLPAPRWILSAACLLACANLGFAQVDMDTNGQDNALDADFYGVTNNTTAEVISVTFDLSVVPGAYWDLDGVSNFGDATDPVIGAIGGMNSGDVSWSYDALYPYPIQVTATFNPPMAAGAFFRFGADTDLFVSDPCPGGNFGSARALTTVTFADSATCHSPFQYLGPTQSLSQCGGGVGFRLADPTPGVAGTTNTISWAGATAGSLVAVAYGFTPGSTPVGAVCPGINVGISSPVLLGLVFSDSSGFGSISGPVPGFLSGQTLLFQAVDLAGCQVTNLVSYTFL
ncbi:MAG: hypothetical protein DWQ01_21350 [Planctomycetota bacterium]|nr:MAG: hypothetical protein DWQ01_21350 [Planctomycetota bacterium]